MSTNSLSKNVENLLPQAILRLLINGQAVREECGRRGGRLEAGKEEGHRLRHDLLFFL